MRAEYSVTEVSWATHQQQLMALRFAVFVGEQGIAAEDERNPKDPECRHFVALHDDATVVGCGRLTPEGQIGRMAVQAALRQTGIGSAILQHILQCARHSGSNAVFLHAQADAAEFYARHGFISNGERHVHALTDQLPTPGNRLCHRPPLLLK